MTESALVKDETHAHSVLVALRNMGIKLSLDDFGTGYSSLSYLLRFPFDKIKIDQSFVQDLTEREDCRAVIRAVIGLAESLGLRTTAKASRRRNKLKFFALNFVMKCKAISSRGPFPQRTC